MKSLTSLILIALSIGLGFLYIKPEWDKISGLQAQKAQYEDALNKAKEINKLSTSLMAAYNSIPDADKTKLEQMIPPTLDSVKLTADLSAVAATYGMSIKGVKITPKGPDQSRTDVAGNVIADPYKTTEVTFTVTGQYPAFVKFLKDVESDVELVDVTGLNISASSQTASNLDFNVKLNTYSVH